MKHFLLSLLVFVGLAPAKAQTKSPDDFLGYPLGSHFTPHQKVLDYFKYISTEAKNVKLIPYGKTYEGRELLVAVISSPENMKNLEEIRKNNLSLSSASKKPIDLKKQPAILWLSYNVHGNEASSTETSMKMLYTLVSASAGADQWLRNTVVIIDPCLNPDGRDRYVNYFNSVSGVSPNVNPESREHIEPWPRGRVNHYYFDLNRDWAWQTQTETQARIVLYHQWMPEVHVDFHEQSYNEPYYFAPAAEPVHQDINAWQRTFQVIVGKNNAKYFDQNGWQYFTKERFDLLYPSYGDTYPLYNGAVGMTYEQGGINAGLAVVTSDGDTLTLKDRIAHHFTTGMATLETVSSYSERLLTEFRKYFEQSVLNPPGNYSTYVVKAGHLPRLKKLAALLKKNHIEYSFGGDKALSGYSFETQKQASFKLERNDLVLNLHQPKAVLASVLFEPHTVVTDSNTYDITAWALPYAYGLNAFAVKESLKGTFNEIQETDRALKAIEKPYAWAFSWTGLEDAQVLIALYKAGIKVRMAEKAFTTGGREFKQGTMLVYRKENEKILPQLEERLRAITGSLNVQLEPIESGFVEKGKDFGSSVYSLLKVPRVAVVSGPETSSQAVGEVWSFFEQELKYPVSLISARAIGNIDLSKINVLVLADGNYPKEMIEPLGDWVDKGGKLILMEGAIASFAEKKPFEIKKKELSKTDKVKIRNYTDREKDDFEDAIPGAIYKVSLDRSHPLFLGLDSYYTLITEDKIYEPLAEGWNAGMLKPGGYVAGLAGRNVKKKLDSGMLFGVQPLGKGTVVYMGSDVLFRLFWESGKQVFTNAVFMVN
jgi:hypothetical protein